MKRPRSQRPSRDDARQPDKVHCDSRVVSASQDPRTRGQRAPRHAPPLALSHGFQHVAHSLDAWHFLKEGPVPASAPRRDLAPLSVCSDTCALTHTLTTPVVRTGACMCTEVVVSCKGATAWIPAPLCSVHPVCVSAPWHRHTLVRCSSAIVLVCMSLLPVASLYPHMWPS